ncbi:MAG: bifunctional folylpolyglutamate synthase/dihydrofolate synthase [Clostridia bacterium]|nr:bifunctional folylpolyglutamate synthase/dihydrofolate synthase [Clostridia bacterium]
MSASDGFSRPESILGLERIAELTARMGFPQDAVPTVHIAGTNGKGSFTAMLASILKEAGLRVGSFTSPAMLGSAESIRIDGRCADEAELEDAITSVKPFALSMRERPTEFEVMTAAAFLMISCAGCDIALIECGLGGDGDSTNVIKSPLLSVITNVQFDHMARLGNTLSEIASHKAGIIKRGRPVLFGGTSAEALAVIQKKAAENSAPLYTVRHDERLISSSLDGVRAYLPGFGELELSLLGGYQAENAANVLEAVNLLRAMGLAIPDEAVKRGLMRTRWPGRCELLCRDPLVMFDGAHNPAGIMHAAETVKTLLGGSAVLLMGVLADKDRSLYAKTLAPYADAMFCVRPSSPRALGPDVLAAEFREAGVASFPFDSFDKGVRAAYNYAVEHGKPLFALGSLYMYAGFRSSLRSITEEHAE